MFNIGYDVETTGIDVYNCEVIKAYFEVHNSKREIVDTYHFKSQVEAWSDEAQEIHKITYEETLQFPSKKKAWMDFSDWIVKYKNDNFICFCNQNTYLGNIVFDKAIIQNELSLIHNEYRFEKLPFYPIRSENVHTLAKLAAKKGYITPLRGESGRQSFKQASLYMAIFNESYEEHMEIADVKAMMRLFYYLKDNKTVNREQTTLI